MKRSALTLYALWAIAVAQPILALLGGSATFFVAHRASRFSLIVFVVLVVFAAPTALALIVRGVAVVSGRAADVLYLVIVGVLIAAIIVPPLTRALGLGTAAAVVLFVGIAAGASYAFRRFAVLRRFATILAIAPIVVVAAFVFFSPARQLVFASGGVTGSTASGRVDTPVVVLGFDELALGSLLSPSGDIDRARFPNFARLSKVSTWYRNATTVAQTTEYAFPAILSGKRPTGASKLPIFSQHPQNLFTLLDGSMPIEATEFITNICAPSICERDPAERTTFATMLSDAAIVYLHYALPAEVAERSLPSLAGRWAGFSDDRDRARAPEGKAFRERVASAMVDDQRARFSGALQQISASTVPSLWYIHLGIPHAPWRYLPSGASYDGNDLPGLRAKRELWIDDGALVDHALQRYLLQLRYSDTVVGETLDHLEAEGLFDRALFLVFADHGVSFRAGGNRRLLDGRNAADILSVPLFVKYPRQTKGAVSRANVETVDILPTIADVVGVRVPWKVDGFSLNDRPPQRDGKRVVAFGKEETLRFPSSIEGVDDFSRRIRQVFGEGGGTDDLYAFGPHGDLVGERASDHVSDTDEGRVIERFPRGFDGVDPTSDYVPARFRAVVDDIEPSRWVAVALNGRIAGVGRTYRLRTTTQVSVMLTPRFFKDGRNAVTLYVIGSDSRLRTVR